MATNQRAQVAEIAEQIGSALMPDNAQWTNRFVVRSHTSDALYNVAQRRSDGSWGCSCPGWRHHRTCKHLHDILGRLSRLEARPGLDTDIIAMLASARFAALQLEGE
jgi:hypothetical protein